MRYEDFIPGDNDSGFVSKIELKVALEAKVS